MCVFIVLIRLDALGVAAHGVGGGVEHVKALNGDLRLGVPEIFGQAEVRLIGEDAVGGGIFGWGCLSEISYSVESVMRSRTCITIEPVFRQPG
ncbi:MAG TPA: hypothetical protein VLM83_13180, partial [Anaerolineales bacterium]|nr:hypothetical protein [Anaerolineales bacterium]